MAVLDRIRWQQFNGAMQILPVLDIMRGQVVRGVGGRRHEYRPIVSRLTASASPLDVAGAIRAHFGRDEFYLADLDPIAGGGPVLVPGSQVSRLAQSDAVARIVDYDHSRGYDRGASTTSEKPLGDDFRVGHCDSALKASPVEVEERVS